MDNSDDQIRKIIERLRADQRTLGPGGREDTIREKLQVLIDELLELLKPL